MEFPSGSVVKNLPANARATGDPDSIPGSGRPPGEGNGNPLQYSCLENPMGGAAWQATDHGLTKSQTQLSNFTSRSRLTLFFTSSNTAFISFIKHGKIVPSSHLYLLFLQSRKLYIYNVVWCYAVAAAKSLQSCPTLCNPTDNKIRNILLVQQWETV